MPTSGLIAASTETQTVLVVEGISKSFPGVKALDHVELSVDRGEVHGIVGENGAGKSTLMAVVSGALAADEGVVRLDGIALEGASPDRARELGVAIVRQEPALMPDLTVAENLYLAMDAQHRPAPHAAASWSRSVLEVWQGLQLDPRLRVEQLGPQMRFVVAICAALAQEPRVLILDEPTEHLLSDEVEVLFELIRERASSGTAVIYISHRIHEVAAIADRITVLRNGHTEGTHPASELTEDQIVGLIVGRDLEAYFPEKGTATSGGVGLRLRGLAAAGLSELDHEFRAGEIVGLAGIDGNGQSALLRALAGLERSTGTFEIGGKRVRKPSPARASKAGIAYLSGDRHHEGILTGLDVEANIAFRSLGSDPRRWWVSNGEVSELGRRVVADFNVKTPTLETPIEALSGGNQQKALLGATLVSGAEVFLIDEPTQGVDIGARAEIYNLLRAAAERGAVVIVLSSSALELAGLADRVLVFSRGQVIDELTDDRLTDESITTAILTATTERSRRTSRTHRWAGWLAGDIAPMTVVSVLIVVLCVVGQSTSGTFLGSVNVSGILSLAVPLAIVAFGQCLVLLTGGIDLSAGPLMGLVAIIGSYYIVDGLSPGWFVVGWILIAAAAIGVGLINWLLIELVGLAPIIATLATYMAVQAVSLLLRPVPGGSISASTTSFLGHSWGVLPAAFVFALVVAIVLELWLKRSRAGIVVRAVGSQPLAARVNGLRPALTRLLAYVGCSLLAGLAGVFLMVQTSIGDASQGVTYTLSGITAAVVGGASVFGGRASFVGALLGALIVGVLSSLTVFLHASEDWQYYLLGLMTLGAVALYSLARRRVTARK